LDLIADIGATHSRCALLNDEGGILAPETFKNAAFPNIEAMFQGYLDHRRTNDKPSRAAIAVAAPILSDYVEMTNLTWSFSQISLQVGLGVRKLTVLNDFEALAWGLVDLDSSSIIKIGRGTAAKRAPLGVIGPGSGLGIASLVPTPDGWTAVAGEGGHVTLPAADAEEAAVIEILRKQFGHCSAERVLSGPGLVNLYLALSERAGRGSATLEPNDVTSLAARGEPLATKTLDMFFQFLGTCAADLAVTLGARGGIYVAGGIVPHLVEVLQQSKFRDRFEQKGRYRSYMAAIPTYVIVEAVPAFRGLRRVLGFS
jgi:glucokinase